MKPLALILVFCMSCIHPAIEKQQLASTQASTYKLMQEDRVQGVWFEGKLESAFDLAADEDKLVFLYWGAIWCPPCNELKSKVFSQAGFPDLMSGFIAVALDGDEESAQLWGEKLGVSGYPTLLLLDASKKEYMRLNTALSFDEFQDHLVKASAKREDFETFFARIESLEGLSSSDWNRLSYLNWSQLSSSEVDQFSQYELLRRIFDESNLANLDERLRLKLTLSYLEMSNTLAAMAEVKESVSKRLEKIQTELKQLLENEDQHYQARGFILYAMQPTLNWLKNEKSRQELQQLWLNAAQGLYGDTRLSLDEKLWSIYPKIQYWKSLNSELPESLKKEVFDHVESIDESAVSEFDRHAVVSGAASILNMVDLYDPAKKLLLKELTQTNTPWYYYSALSSLSEQAGELSQALSYMSQARQVAEGRASKIQWTVSELLLLIKYEDLSEPKQREEVLKAYYDLVFSFDDGFVGRNYLRSERLAFVLKQKQAYHALLENYQTSCQSLEGLNRANCQRHFDLIGL